MAAERVSWFSMLTFLPQSSRPFVFFLSFCAKPSFNPSTDPHGGGPLPTSLPLAWQPLGVAFFRSPSAMARQDAAPPEVARRLGNGQRGRAEEGGFLARGGI